MLFSKKASQNVNFSSSNEIKFVFGGITGAFLGLLILLNMRLLNELHEFLMAEMIKGENT